MNLGAPEILVILVVALLVFGPHKLPEIGRQVGGAMRELRKMQDSVKQELQTVMNDDQPRYDKPVSAPLPTTPEPSVHTTPEIEAATSMIEEPDHTEQPPPPPPSPPDAGFDGPSGSFS
jgi:sec-independent protein translocase protein TatA